MELLISLLNLFIQSLVLDLELLKVDQVQAVSQLLLLLVDLVKIVVSVAQRNVLQTVLMHFLVLETLVHFPLLDQGVLQFLARAREDSILGN